ncbi:MAG TPA: HlyD family efflux transporter periplasmic adaptor subunit [Gammaproteobacteria bacterium]|nr:HlyD family efflux transporter periplasmic adaptor subunit [Gammaproteobacteria bacterium]
MNALSGETHAVKRTLRVIIPLALLAAAAAGFLYFKKTKAPRSPASVVERIWNVTTKLVRLGKNTPELSLLGEVMSDRVAYLKSTVEGDIRAVEVVSGQRVTAQQVLIRIDDVRFRLTREQRQADVAELRAQIQQLRQSHEADQQAQVQEKLLLTLAQTNLERAQRLARSKVAAVSRVDDARKLLVQQQLAMIRRNQVLTNFPASLAALDARRQRALAALQIANDDLSHTVIRAPFSGRVLTVQVAVGDRSSKNTPLLSLVPDHSLQLRAELPQRYLSLIYAHQGTTEATLSWQDQNYPMRLDRIAAEIMKGRSGVDAYFVFTGQEPQLAIGRILELQIKLPPIARSVVVPITSVYGGARVYRLVDGRMRRLDVKIQGQRKRRNYTEVILSSAKLQDGDQLVVTPLPQAIDGLRVRSAGSAAGKAQ